MKILVLSLSLLLIAIGSALFLFSGESESVQAAAIPEVPDIVKYRIDPSKSQFMVMPTGPACSIEGAQPSDRRSRFRR